MSKHPLQPLYKDEEGTLRFKANPIVSFLLDAGPFDMNQLAVMPFEDADREQFAQLIGYSKSGFSELSYVSDQAYESASAMDDDPTLNEKDARIAFLEGLLGGIAKDCRKAMAALYAVHPDDLNAQFTEGDQE